MTSGQRYYAYVRDHIFKPVGMNSTDTLAEEDHVPKLVIAGQVKAKFSYKLLAECPDYVVPFVVEKMQEI
jgi:CubicO group peptidase (beta-lactamase class C family)